MNRWHVYEMLKGQIIPTLEMIKEVQSMDEKELKEGVVEWLYLKNNNNNKTQPEQITIEDVRNLIIEARKGTYNATKEYECYQCKDKGLLLIPMKSKNGLIYDYMFQCSCRRGGYFPQLPKFDISRTEVREVLKSLANKNYNEYLSHKNSCILSK